MHVCHIVLIVSCKYVLLWQVNSEFYTGWLDYWKGGHAHSSTEQIVATLQALRVYGASVNMYVIISRLCLALL